MQRKMSREHAIMAYVLNDHFRYSQAAIAQLMKVSQSTISNAIREVSYWRTIQNLQQELQEAHQQLIALGIQEPPPPLVIA